MHARHRPSISFIVPVRNGRRTLARCLRSIAANDYPRDRVEIIVADNGSTDGSRDLGRAAGAIVLDLPNLSPAELRNRAAGVASGRVLAFVDADHEIASDWITSALDALSGQSVGAAGAQYHPPSPATWVQRGYDALRGHVTGRRDVEWIGSGNLAVWKSVFERIGGFEPALVTCEDVDFCRRLRATGFRIIADDRLHTTHFGDPRTLAELFRGELWRGRDNLRVTLRRPLSLRSLASLVVPAADLVLIGAVTGAAVWGGPQRAALVAVASGAAILTFAALRTFAKLRASTLTAIELGQVLVVAAVHDVARAFALMFRARHTMRQAPGSVR
jgi:glycosyltransferase involved in cell wall biosynthesis